MRGRLRALPLHEQGHRTVRPIGVREAEVVGGIEASADFDIGADCDATDGVSREVDSERGRLHTDGIRERRERDLHEVAVLPDAHLPRITACGFRGDRQRLTAGFRQRVAGERHPRVTDVDSIVDGRPATGAGRTIEFSPSDRNLFLRGHFLVGRPRLLGRVLACPRVEGRVLVDRLLVRVVWRDLRPGRLPVALDLLHVRRLDAFDIGRGTHVVSVGVRVGIDVDVVVVGLRVEDALEVVTVGHPLVDPRTVDFGPAALVDPPVVVGLARQVDLDSHFVATGAKVVAPVLAAANAFPLTGNLPAARPGLFPVTAEVLGRLDSVVLEDLGLVVVETDCGPVLTRRGRSNLRAVADPLASFTVLSDPLPFGTGRGLRDLVFGVADDFRRRIGFDDTVLVNRNLGGRLVGAHPNEGTRNDATVHRLERGDLRAVLLLLCDTRDQRADLLLSIGVDDVLETVANRQDVRVDCGEAATVAAPHGGALAGLLCFSVLTVVLGGHSSLALLGLFGLPVETVLDEVRNTLPNLLAQEVTDVDPSGIGLRWESGVGLFFCFFCFCLTRSTEVRSDLRGHCRSWRTRVGVRLASFTTAATSNSVLLDGIFDTGLHDVNVFARGRTASCRRRWTRGDHSGGRHYDQSDQRRHRHWRRSSVVVGQCLLTSLSAHPSLG